MDPQPQKLQHRVNLTNDQETESTQSHIQEGQTFETVEDLLRHDLANTPLPSSIEERLRKSIADSPTAPQPWWRRILGK
ncbi:MAG: hypothetical protein WCO60_15155 [Verrucomicrobiota bacterium]